MVTDTFLWTRHAVEGRRGCRANRPGDGCSVGRTLYAKAGFSGGDMWEDIPRTNGGYHVILIDPPWPYRQALLSKKTRGGAAKHYNVLTMEEIAALPIPELAAGDAQLWLWTTNAHLPTAFELVRTWGFTYKVMRTWTKTNGFGGGYWLRGQTEPLLLAIRGNARFWKTGPHGAAGHNVSTAILAPRGEHSVKPPRSYADIEFLSSEPPGLKRLELFTRGRRQGWTWHGNERSDTVQGVLGGP